MIKELDTVVLSRDLPENGLKRGDIRTFLHCYKGEEAFDVEFITGQVATGSKQSDIDWMQGIEASSFFGWIDRTIPEKSKRGLHLHFLGTDT